MIYYELKLTVTEDKMAKRKQVFLLAF